MLHGWIGLYEAQGMNCPAHVFQDARFARSRTEGWGPDGLFVLGAGCHLTILADSGEILWTGALVARRRRLRWLLPHRDEGWRPDNADWTVWNSYFEREPPLNARLIPAAKA